MSDFGQNRTPVARKDHQCIWCAEKIPKGEKHIHFVGMFQGEFQDWRMHNECNEAADEIEDIAVDGFEPFANLRPEKKVEK